MTDKEITNKCQCSCEECGDECNPFGEKRTNIPSNEPIIIDGVDVSGCRHLRTGVVPFGCMEDRKTFSCMNNPNCYYKQLQRKTAECQRMKYFLNKIRYFELESLDVDWDRYEQEKDCTDFSPIITYVEHGLGEIEKDDD